MSLPVACMHAGGSSAGLPLAGLPVIISVCLSLQKNSCMAFGDQRQGHAPRLCCLVAQVICCCWVDTASKAASYLKNCRSWSYNCITIYATTSLSDSQLAFSDRPWLAGAAFCCICLGLGYCLSEGYKLVFLSSCCGWLHTGAQDTVSTYCRFMLRETLSR